MLVGLFGKDTVGGTEDGSWCLKAPKRSGVVLDDFPPSYICTMSTRTVYWCCGVLY